MSITRPKPNQDRPKDAQCVFGGVLFDVYQWQQEMYDGTFETFEQLTRDDSVNIIPVTKEGNILITEQEQPGSKPFVGLPGGMIDRGEDVLVAAKRELIEETGYTAESYELWNAVQPAGKVDWVIYTYIARGCTKVADLKLDAGEKIITKEITFDEMVEIVIDPEFRDMEFAMRILRAKANREIDALKEMILKVQ